MYILPQLFIDVYIYGKIFPFDLMYFTIYFIHLKINVILVFSILCFNQYHFFAEFLDNIALRKSAWQLHPYQNVKFKEYTNASKAVDGLKSNLSFTALQCTYSEDLQNIASWRVDLGAVLGIHHITIYYRTDGVPWGRYCQCFGLMLSFVKKN